MITDICREIVNGVRIGDINCGGVDCYKCPLSGFNNSDDLACGDRSAANNMKIAKQYLNETRYDKKLNEVIKECTAHAANLAYPKEVCDKHYDLMNWLLELKELREFKNNVMNAIYK